MTTDPVMTSPSIGKPSCKVPSLNVIVHSPHGRWNVCLGSPSFHRSADMCGIQFTPPEHMRHEQESRLLQLRFNYTQIVESVGEGVNDLKPGDHVLPIFTGECKECRHCLSEESNNMCELLRINCDRGVMLADGKTRFSINGKPIYHFVGTSTFSQYTVVHVGQVAKISPTAPLDKVCPISCGICTGFGATVNVAKPKKGQTVAVFGLGAVGLAAAEGARVCGASRIIAVDVNPRRFEEEVIVEMTGGGVDRSVECTGSVEAMISAFECVHDGWGVCVLVGVPKKDDAFKTHPMNLLSERTLKGAFYGNYKPRTDIPMVVDKYLNKELGLDMDKFITHSLPFADINKAFDYMLQGIGLRCMIHLDA
ncbi:alcohol dehydrogenase class-P-like isoform X2 [Gossypium australe]|uniref:Alcohol dehydrogenase class-P-like isoform X2 n=1 Tax=Gossypium australe TaxID=47621 RepID=A0A5B6V7X0_9ROSI|nr:alcohol dehydrogenase class-P-like isoform X2 [Gossypium australe]